MQVENSFEVAAPPDEVFAFLLDINRVAGCVPGVELTEVVDPDTFKGKVKIKVGPITVSYNGTARIAERDPAVRTARIEFSGRETTGPGGTEGSGAMSVESDGAASRVKVVADFVVRGRVANFGRGVMEDVSRRLVGQMADCIKASLEASGAAPTGGAPAPGAVPAAAPGAGQPAGTVAPPSPAPGPDPAGAAVPSGPAAGQSAGSGPLTAGPAADSARPAPAATRPVNALSLFFSILWERIRRPFRRRS